MSDRKPTSVVIPAAVALVLLGAYVGAYYWCVYPAPEYDVFGHQLPKLMPIYPSDDETWEHALSVPHVGRERFFAPIHWLDRRVRPHVWKTP